ncbi:hypothetical protein BSB_22790 [Bacillus stercoris]|nr:hypothetical protein BSB_22790 [Bacillus stercoris]
MLSCYYILTTLIFSIYEVIVLVIKNAKREWIKIAQVIKTRVENVNWDSIQNELDEHCKEG